MTIKENGVYAMYLRKSRADAEAEARGEFETLARHYQILSELAERYHVKISKVYKELVSGESIASRPEVKKLLDEVNNRIYDGVFVTEISRLARGNTLDQGIMQQAFHESGTLIITPSKIYNPEDDSDETFYEFELFMARQEYKYIKKRMLAGRIASRKAGNRMGFAPLGYIKQGLTLIPSDDAPIIQHIFEMYAGGSTMHEILTFARASIPGHYWESSSLVSLVRNAAYCGFSNPIGGTTEYIPGNWEPIVSKELFEACQNRYNTRPKLNKEETLLNPFAGLLRCKYCGYVLAYVAPRNSGLVKGKFYHRRRGRPCYHPYYPIGIDEFKDDVFKAICEATPVTEETKITGKDTSKLIAAQEKRLAKARLARESLFDKFDTGFYTAEEYKQRRKKWDTEIESASQELRRLQNLNKRTEKLRIVVSPDEVKKILYNTQLTPHEINMFLKTFIDRIEYSREEEQAEPEIIIYPR